MNSNAPTLAAIDAGSNTIHLVVASLTPDKRNLTYAADDTVLVRLGADVSTRGAIGPERMRAAITTIQEQTEKARALGATTLLGIATEGVRAARNSAEFLASVREATGVSLEMITGDQEAALTYWGATSGTPYPDQQQRQAVLDLGGGSLELVAGEGTRVEWRVSLPLGSGAMHDRYAPADPAVSNELATVRRVVTEALRDLDPPLPVARVTACGGTATALLILAGAAGLAPATTSDPTNTRPQSLSRAQMDNLLDLLQHTSADEIGKRYGIEVGRAKLLGAGDAVLLAAMERMGVETLHISRRGIREGALLAYAHTGGAWLQAATTGAGW